MCDFRRVRLLHENEVPDFRLTGNCVQDKDKLPAPLKALDVRSIFKSGIKEGEEVNSPSQTDRIIQHTVGITSSPASTPGDAACAAGVPTCVGTHTSTEPMLTEGASARRACWNELVPGGKQRDQLHFRSIVRGRHGLRARIAGCSESIWHRLVQSALQCCYVSACSRKVSRCCANACVSSRRR